MKKVEVVEGEPHLDLTEADFERITDALATLLVAEYLRREEADRQERHRPE